MQINLLALDNYLSTLKIMNETNYQIKIICVWTLMHRSINEKVSFCLNTCKIRKNNILLHNNNTDNSSNFEKKIVAWKKKQHVYEDKQNTMWLSKKKHNTMCCCMWWGEWFFILPFSVHKN